MDPPSSVGTGDARNSTNSPNIMTAGPTSLEPRGYLDGALMTIEGTGTNSDGYKEKGITFPSSKQQHALFTQV